MPTRIIFDTDIGTDVDDCLALALVLASPELEPVGITCVYGDTILRARMALKLLKLRGRTEIPVRAGMQKPILGIRPVYWAGHEGEGLLTAEDEQVQPSGEFAPHFIMREVMEHPGEIHLIGTGPLNDIAFAMLREPRLAANLRHLTIMGGVVRGSDDLHLPYAEHNIICDPEAAHIVFSSITEAGTPMTVIPLNITVQVRIRREGLQRIKAAGTPYHEAVADQLERYPYFATQGWTVPHDPLAIASVIDPSFVTLKPVHVDVETQGRFSTGATLFRSPRGDEKGNIQVATAVEVERFEEFLVSRLAS